MKVLLLAAGQSTRLEPISDKILLKFCGKTLLQHQIERIHKAGLENFIIVGNKFNLKQLKEICRKLPYNFKFTEQTDLTQGMAGCVLAAQNFVKSNESILVISSNDLLEENAFRLILEAAHRHPQASLLLGKKIQKYFPGGYLKIDSKNRIQNIVEKPKPGTEPSDLINLVVHYHYNAQLFFQELNKTQSNQDDLYEKAIDNQIKKGINYFVVPYQGFWQAVKYPWHILDLQKYFLENLHSHIDSTVKLAKNVTLKGHVYLGKNVRIFENAIINGPVYLGDNCIIANNSLVRESLLGDNCVIGFSSEIARSYLHQNIWTHSNYIGDSVLDQNISFGAGCVTGNLRFDEKNINVEIRQEKINCGKNKLGAIIGKNVRFGVNTSLMPGIKIGTNSIIGAGLYLNQNIPQNSYVKAKENNLKISHNLFLKKLPQRENFLN